MIADLNTSLSLEERRNVQREHIEKNITSYINCISRLKLLSNFIFIASLAAISIFIFSAVENGALKGSLMFHNTTEYGMIIDAGSHGSRLHLYSWPSRIHDREHPLTGPITFPIEIISFRRSPGISIMANTPNPTDTGRVCIGPLIDDVKAFLRRQGIAKEKWPSFPIFLKATAGMRNLDASSRSLIMTSIRKYLSDPKTTPFTFQWNWARIVAGEEEGVYGWLTVNNAFNTILKPASETIGALDMGGASMQITFSPYHTSVLENYYGLILGGQTLRLYSHSFLGYGWADSLSRITTKLGVEEILESQDKKKKSTAIVISRTNHSSYWDSYFSTNDIEKIYYLEAFHPCYPAGHTLEYTMPPLSLPDGRFYVDLNNEQLTAYMQSIGLPNSYIKTVISSKFLSSASPFQKPSSETSILNSLTTQLSNSEEQIMFSYGKPLNPIYIPEEPLFLEDVNNNNFLIQPNTSSSLSLSVGKNETRMLMSQNNKKKSTLHNDATTTSTKRVPRYHWIIRFTGTSDFYTCRQMARSLFYEQPCFIHSCSFNGAYQPRLENSHFIAFGQYSKVRAALNVSERPTLSDIELAAIQFCKKSRKELYMEYQQNSTKYSTYSKKALIKLCWKAIWTHTTLQWGYGFSDNSTKIRFSPPPTENTTNSGVEGASSGWATGSMLYEVNNFPWKIPQTHFEWPFLWGSIATCVLTILACTHLNLVRQQTKVITLAGLIPPPVPRGAFYATSPLLFDDTIKSTRDYREIL